MAFTLIDLTDGGQIKIGEAQEDNSFVREENNDNPQITVKFNIFGAQDASTAYLALISYLETNFDDGNGGIANYDLPLDTVRISTRSASNAYVGECVFKYPNEQADTEINDPQYTLPEIEDADYSFDTTGGSAHITHGTTLYAARPDNGTPVDYGGLIGPREDGTADGCDIITPTMRFTISVSLPKAWFTQAYRILIATYSGAINSAAWDGYAAGEVMFHGVQAKPVWMSWTDANGDQQKDWYWRATFSFSASPNVTLTVGSSTIIKRGWDVLSKISERYSDANGNTCSGISQVNVYAVYPEFDFALLNLPLPT